MADLMWWLMNIIGPALLIVVEEIVQFAKRMGFRKLGIANCISFVDHAKVLSGILESHGFEVVSACCKNGSIPKEDLGIADAQKILDQQGLARRHLAGRAAGVAGHVDDLDVAADLADAGCRYLQFDDTVWAYLCSPAELQKAKERGDEGRNEYECDQALHRKPPDSGW